MFEAYPSHGMPRYTGLSDLLDQDLSAYEFYNGLPPEVRQKLAAQDASSFEEMQRIAKRSRSEGFSDLY